MAKYRSADKPIRPHPLTPLIRRAGVQTHEAEVNHVLAQALEALTIDLIRTAHFYTLHRRRYRLTVRDLNRALEEWKERLRPILERSMGMEMRERDRIPRLSPSPADPGGVVT